MFITLTFGLFWGYCHPALAANEIVFSIDPSTGSFDVGDELEVTLQLTNSAAYGVDLSSVGIRIEFSTSTLSYAGYDDSDSNGSTNNLFNGEWEGRNGTLDGDGDYEGDENPNPNTSGYLYFTGGSLIAPTVTASSTEDLIVLHFDITRAGTGALQYQFTEDLGAEDENLSLVTVALDDGAADVSDHSSSNGQFTYSFSQDSTPTEGSYNDGTTTPTELPDTAIFGIGDENSPFLNPFVIGPSFILVGALAYYFFKPGIEDADYKYIFKKKKR